MKKHIFHVLFVLGFAALSVACGGGKKQAGGTDMDTRAGKGLVVSLSDSLIEHRRSDTLRFGRVKEGEKVMQEFTVRNAADKALVITGINVSCGCTEVEYPKQPLMPDEEGRMKLTLDTKGLGGYIFKRITIQTSLTGRPYVLFVAAEIR